MPIRFKTVPYCWWTPRSGNDPSPTYVCVDQVVPIRDWNISPGQLNKQWTQGTIAQSLYQDVTFPELEFVYTNYTQFRYKIRKIIPSVDWLNIHSTNFGNAQTFEITTQPVIRFYYDFVNLDNLPVGLHTIDVFFDAYGVDSQNQEHYLENYSTTVTLNVKSGTGISTDKNTYQITYNKANDTLSGDDKIIIYTNDAVTYNVPQGQLFVTLNQASVSGEKHLVFTNNSDIQNKAVGNYSGTVTIVQNGFSKTVNVNLEVINDATEFDVNPKIFNISLQKNPGAVKTVTSNISNPNNLTIVVDLKPTFISDASINNGILTIVTDNSSNLAIGNYSGKVILKAGTKTKEVTVNLNIFQAIDHDFSGSAYFFAMDPNKAIITKTNAEATYVKMQLDMYFKGYGEEYSETQLYTIPFFQGKTEFKPGKEINDFFIKCKNIEGIDGVQYLMNLAQVTITFYQMNDSDEVLSTIVLDNILFAPGKKPLCFPVFTNYPVRRTFDKSKIQLTVDRLSTKYQIEALKDLYTEIFIVGPSTTCLDRYTFKRDKFNNGLVKKIIGAQPLTFIPVPEKRELIHIEWETSNLIFEWLSVPLKYQKKDEIENVFGESRDYKEEKFDSEDSNTLILNTGWILQEEIGMITDLLKSRLCFITLKGKRIKAYPVGKKNDLDNTDDTTFQTDIEFKILKENE